MSKWVSNYLGELVTFQKGRKVDTSPFPKAGYNAYLGAKALSGKSDGYGSTYFSVQANDNDVLMLWDGERSGLVQRGLSGVVSSTVCKLSPTEAIGSDLLYYFLNLNFDWIQNRRTGTGVPHVPKNIGRILELTYPSNKGEQRRIVRILQTIDRAIEQTETLIDKYQQIRAGLMHDLFTRGIGPDGQLRPHREEAQHLYQETPVGWIPRGWHYELLDNLAVRGSGHTPSKSHPEYWNGGVKWLSLADSPNLDKLYISETAFEISDKGLQNSSAVLQPPGAVVLSRDAGIGKSAITTTSMAVSQHFMCWRGGPEMDNHFLYYWLQNNKRVFENIAMGSTILTIGLSYFKRLRIACPQDIPEQESIAEKLKLLDAQLFSLEDDLQKKKHQKSGLMHDLLTGQIAVIPEPEASDLEAV